MFIMFYYWQMRNSLIAEVAWLNLLSYAYLDDICSLLLSLHTSKTSSAEHDIDNGIKIKKICYMVFLPERQNIRKNSQFFKIPKLKCHNIFSSLRGN